jgi:hypothetical protein
MSGAGPVPPERLPTLTEIVEWNNASASGEPDAGPGPALPAEADLAGEAAMRSMALRMPEQQLIQNVLVEVQRQIELMLEYRMREVLAPMLSRATDSLIREARAELASTLRDVVARAVAQELARHRTR